MVRAHEWRFYQPDDHIAKELSVGTMLLTISPAISSSAHERVNNILERD